MSDDTKKASEPVPQKEDPKKVEETENPKKHGSEAGGAPGEGRTGTGLGSTDS